jgi:predicted transcriptional regulator
LKEEQLKVLKALSEATSRMDLAMFAQKVNLTANQTMYQIQELAKEGFLQKVGGGYGITQKGKAALKGFAAVPKEMSFHFYFGIDQPSEFKAESLEQFYREIKQIRVQSLEFHLYRGDFEKWLKDVCKEPELAIEFGSVSAMCLKDEELRVELLKALDAKYSINGRL